VAGLSALCASDDGSSFYVGTDDCHIACWVFPAIPAQPNGGGRRVLDWKAHDDRVLRIILWKCWIISASEDRSIRIWCAKTGLVKDELYGHAGAVLILCIAQHEQLLWSGARDLSVRSWDLVEVEHRFLERDRMLKMDRESRAVEVEVKKQARELRRAKSAQARNRRKSPAKGGSMPRRTRPKSTTLPKLSN